jgi:hypothetical protein
MPLKLNSPALSVSIVRLLKVSAKEIRRTVAPSSALLRLSITLPVSIPDTVLTWAEAIRLQIETNKKRGNLLNMLD